MYERNRAAMHTHGAPQAVVKQFFNEKEVTSTLVMDALYSGCKQMEEHSRTWLEVSFETGVL